MTSPKYRNEAIETEILLTIKGIRLLTLNSSVSESLTFGAGLENSIGDYIITFNTHLDPLQLITSSVELMQNGSEVVIGRAKYQSSVLYRFLTVIFHKFISKIVGYGEPQSSTHFRALTRKSLNILLAKKRHIASFLSLTSSIGLNTTVLDYKFNSKIARRDIKNRIVDLFNVLVLSSTNLLKAFSLLGFFSSIFALCISTYVFAIKVFSDNVIEGWSSLSLFVSIQFCLLFLILFIFGLYIARLIDERWEFSEYEVADERTSQVMFEGSRRNVVEG